jgi:hypothetical protein
MAPESTASSGPPLPRPAGHLIAACPHPARPPGAHVLPTSGHAPAIAAKAAPELELPPAKAAPSPPSSPRGAAAARRTHSGELESPRTLARTSAAGSFVERVRTLSPTGSIKLPHAVEVLAQPLAPAEVPPPTICGIWRMRWQVSSRPSDLLPRPRGAPRQSRRYNRPLLVRKKKALPAAEGTPTGRLATRPTRGRGGSQSMAYRPSGMC